MFIKTNPNPNGTLIGDCVVRAICIALNRTWDEVYIGLCVQGYILRDMPNANHVWGRYLIEEGFMNYPLINTCPECYTIKDFCFENNDGIFILATGSHVVTVIDGDYYDSWDSGNEIPISVWRRE